MEKKVWMVHLNNSQNMPLRIEADFAFVDNHHALIFGDRRNDPGPPDQIMWAAVAGFSSSTWKRFRCVGHISR